MKSIRTLVSAIAATSLVSFAIYAHAEDSKGCDRTDRPHHRSDNNDDGLDGRTGHAYQDRQHPPFGKFLNLTDGQKQILEASRKTEKANRETAREKMRVAHEALNKAGNENADDATLNRLSNELAAIIAQQEIARVKAHREFVAMLTTEQKQKLDAFEAEHKGPARWRDRPQDEPRAK